MVPDRLRLAKRPCLLGCDLTSKVDFFNTFQFHTLSVSLFNVYTVQ